MKVVANVKKNRGCEYLLNEAGEVIEIRTESKPILKIRKEKGKLYELLGNGDVVEKEVVAVSLDEFYAMKKDGRLAGMFREGKEVDVKTADAPLSALEKFEMDYLTESIEGRCVKKAKITREKDGGRVFTLTLDSGKTITLREGLLVGGSTVDID
ncbi:MAG: hypothetical protein ACP5NX_02220 [Candidatus Bilamarchaeaceae archaeon]